MSDRAFLFFALVTLPFSVNISTVHSFTHPPLHPHPLLLALARAMCCREYERCAECCDAAVVAGEAAGAEDSLLGKAHFRCGKALVGLERFGDAVKAFKRALERNRCVDFVWQRE